MELTEYGAQSVTELVLPLLVDSLRATALIGSLTSITSDDSLDKRRLSYGLVKQDQLM